MVVSFSSGCSNLIERKLFSQMCGTELSNCLSSYIFSRCAGILAFVLAILHMVSQCLLSKSARNSDRNTKVEDEEEPALLNNSDL